MAKARLQEIYENQIRPDLKKNLGVKNVMQIPKIEKIVLNVGVGKEAVADSKSLNTVVEIVKKISGQSPVKTTARKSIATFKLRSGMPIGVRVTLRKKNMYEFLDKLINLALPKTRDFQGVSTQLDGRGNYNLGLKEISIFPEVDYDLTQKMSGLNVTICTSAKTDEHGFALLKSLGMPFKKGNK